MLELISAILCVLIPKIKTVDLYDIFFSDAPAALHCHLADLQTFNVTEGQLFTLLRSKQSVRNSPPVVPVWNVYCITILHIIERIASSRRSNVNHLDVFCYICVEYILKDYRQKRNLLKQCILDILVYVLVKTKNGFHTFGIIV